MLSDPLSVTFNGSAKSLARTSVGPAGSVYTTSDGEFNLTVEQSTTDRGLVRREITLEHKNPDPSLDIFSDDQPWVPNRFGLVYETDERLSTSSTEIPLLRTALLAFVDASLQTRILGNVK
jgi:hypothetical protein